MQRRPSITIYHQAYELRFFNLHVFFESTKRFVYRKAKKQTNSKTIYDSIFWLCHHIGFIMLQRVSRRLISDRADKVSAIEMVNTGSIPRRVKPNATETGNHSFPASCSSF